MLNEEVVKAFANMDRYKEYFDEGDIALVETHFSTYAEGARLLNCSRDTFSNRVESLVERIERALTIERQALLSPDALLNERFVSMSKRLEYALKNDGIITYGDILMKGKDYFTRVPNVGKASFNHLLDDLDYLGLSFESQSSVCLHLENIHNNEELNILIDKDLPFSEVASKVSCICYEKRWNEKEVVWKIC